MESLSVFVAKSQARSLLKWFSSQLELGKSYRSSLLHWNDANLSIYWNEATALAGQMVFYQYTDFENLFG